MARLDLFEEEVVELSIALNDQLHGLRVELADTDDRAFRADLRARMNRLERVAARLQEAAGANGASAPASIGNDDRNDDRNG